MIATAEFAPPDTRAGNVAGSHSRGSPASAQELRSAGCRPLQKVRTVSLGQTQALVQLGEPQRLDAAKLLDCQVPGVVHERTAQIGAGQIGVLEIRVMEEGAAQVDVAEVGPPQVATGQLGAPEVRPVEIGPAQNGFLQVRTAQIGAAQVGLGQTGQVHAAKGGATEMSHAQVGHDARIVPAPLVPRVGALLDQGRMFRISHAILSNSGGSHCSAYPATTSATLGTSSTQTGRPTVTS